MGKTLTPQQKDMVHTKLDVDANGKVVFSEFVQLAQEMFAFKMEGSHLEAGLVLALTQKDDLEPPPYRHKVISTTHSNFRNRLDYLTEFPDFFCFIDTLV